MGCEAGWWKGWTGEKTLTCDEVDVCSVKSIARKGVKTQAAAHIHTPHVTHDAHQAYRTGSGTNLKPHNRTRRERIRLTHETCHQKDVTDIISCHQRSRIPDQQTTRYSVSLSAAVPPARQPSPALC